MVRVGEVAGAAGGANGFDVGERLGGVGVARGGGIWSQETLLQRPIGARWQLSEVFPKEGVDSFVGKASEGGP